MRSRRKPTVDYLGNYASGFVIRNEKLDFDRELYLEQFLGTHIYTFMSSVAQTQMFEQVQSIRMFGFLQRFVSCRHSSLDTARMFNCNAKLILMNLISK